MKEINKFRNLLLTLTLFIIIFFSIIIRIYPYLVQDYPYEIGFDTGMYQHIFLLFQSSSYWPIIPAYPNLEIYEESFKIWMEPGLFVLISITNIYMGLSVSELFRFYLPTSVSFLSIFFVYVAVFKITKSKKAAIISSLIFSISYIQIDAINESFYKQLFGTIVLLIALIQFDGYLKTKKNNYLITFSIISSSLIAFHRTITFIFGLTMFFYIVYYLYKKDYYSLKKIIIVIGSILFISSIIWIPIFKIQIKILMESLQMSFQGFLCFFSNVDKEQVRHIGGAVPRLLRNENNLFIGYNSILFYPILGFFGGYYVMRKKLSSSFFILITILLIYILLKMNASSRLLIDFDIINLILVSIFIVHYKFKKTTQVFVVILLFLSMFSLNINYQSERLPYITEDSHGINWIQKNIPINKTLIFAPDYLSSVLIKYGYRTAFFDDTLLDEKYFPGIEATSSPKFKNELFLINGYNNLTLIKKYYDLEVDNIDIYVLWGSWDERNKQPRIDDLILVERWSSSNFFEEIYSKKGGQISKIYRWKKNNQEGS